MENAKDFQERRVFDCRPLSRFARYFVWAHLLLASGWLSISPAHAQTALQICDSYPFEMSAQDLSDAALKLKYNMPASRVRALLQVEVQNIDAPGPVAPYVEPAAKRSWVIYVPKGFRRLQCRLLQYEFYQINGAITPQSDINDLIAECVRLSGPWKCLDQFVVQPASDLEGRYPYDPANAALLKQLVDSAFDNVMMHEAAHIILRDMRGKRAPEGDEEVRADLLALSGGMGAGNPQIGAIATPAMMSLLDNLRDPAGDDHPPAACRAADNDEIVREIGPQIGALFQWLFDPEQYPKVRSQPPSLGVKIWIPGLRTKCVPTDMMHTKGVRADLDKLLAILDGIHAISPDEQSRWEQAEKYRTWRLSYEESVAQMTLGRNGQRGAVDYSRKEWERAPAERQFDAILEELLGFAPQTPEGQRLRATISSLWIARWVLDEHAPTGPSAQSDPMFPLPPDMIAAENEAGKKRELLANLDRLNRSWDALTHYDITSEDYGRLLGLRAIFTYLASPPGSSIKKIAAQQIKSLGEAELYYSGSVNATLQQGIAELLSGHCERARVDFKLARPSIYSKDSEHLRLIDTVIGSDDAGCNKINKDLREELKRDLRWVD